MILSTGSAAANAAAKGRFGRREWKRSTACARDLILTLAGELVCVAARAVGRSVNATFDERRHPLEDRRRCPCRACAEDRMGVRKNPLV